MVFSTLVFKSTLYYIMRKYYFIIGLFLSLSQLITPNHARAQSWLPALGQGVDDAPLAFVNAAIEYQGNLIITGEFANVSGISCTYVAQWNGTSWQAMGSGLPAVGKCLAIYNNELYAGLDALGSSTLQKWNGSNWEASGPFDAPITSLYVDETSGTFYAGGSFTTPGKYIAKYSGGTWTGIGALQAGTSSFPRVDAISVYQGQLYVGGTFGGGTTVKYLAKLDASNNFVGIHADLPNQPVNDFAQQDNMLFIGGAFSKIGTASMRGLAQWDGTAWIDLASDQSGPNTALGGVKTVTSYKGQLYVGGTFSNIFVTGLEVNNVARWNGCSWKNLSDGISTIGVSGPVNELIVMGDNLFIGGEFKDAGGTANVNRAVFWNNVTECPDPICFTTLPEITISSPNAQGCTGTAFSFSSVIERGGTNPIYQWKVDGANVGTNSSSFSSSSLTDGQVVTCEITSDDPCVSAANGTSNAITVSIVTELIPTITISADQTSACSGQNINFSSSVSNGGSAPTYEWFVDGSSVGTGVDLTLNNLNDGQNVSCTLISSESCANPTSATSNVINMTIIPSTTPGITIQSDLTEICAGDAVVFSSNITEGGNAPSYQWQVDGTNVASTVATYSTSALTDGQQVSCILTSSDACASTASVSSNSITITVVSDANVSLNSGVLTTTTSGSSYQWINCGDNSDIVGETGTTFTPTQSGTYKVQVIVGNCTVFSSCETVLINALSENGKNPEFELYPNPVTSELQVRAQGLTEVRIYTLDGKRIFSSKVSNQNLTIDLENQPEGMYLIQLIINEKNSYFEKIIKK